MFSSYQGPRTAEHVEEDVITPPPPTLYLCTLPYAHTHLKTSLFSFGIKARAWPWPDCWGGFLSNSPEGDPIMWHPSPSLMRGRRHSPQACVQLQGLSFNWVITPRSNGVEVVSGPAERLQPSPPWSEFESDRPQVSTRFDCGDKLSRFSHLLNSQSLIPAYVRERSFHVQSDSHPEWAGC